MKYAIIFGIIAITFTYVPVCRSTLRTLIQNNVAGPSINFETASWPFDPDAGMLRRREYEAVNGRLGYKHVERLGLGEDGRTEERRREQQIRDSVGGLSYQVPT